MKHVNNVWKIITWNLVVYEGLTLLGQRKPRGYFGIDMQVRQGEKKFGRETS